jgi:superfamily II DNA/RNA helicase
MKLKVLDDADKMVTFNKQRPVHSRIFKKTVLKPWQTAHKSATYRNPVAQQRKCSQQDV